MPREKRAVATGAKARQHLLEGINRLADPVKVTLGAEGKHVVIEDKDYEYPVITRDGVAVARSISFGDNRIEQGARMAKDAATECWKVAGDGTTSTIVITQALCNELAALIDPANKETTLKKQNCLAKGVRQAALDAIEVIRKLSEPVTKETLLDIAIVSANNDEEIGKIVSDVVWEVGQNGSVIVKTGKDKHVVEVLQGSILKSGYLTPELINNNMGTRTEVDPVVFVTDFEWSKVADVVKFLETYQTKMNGTPVVIIGKEFIGDARSALVRAYLELRLPIVLVEAPYEGDRMRTVLRDIAIATGATFLGTEKGYAIGDMWKSSYFGKCKRVDVYDDETRFIKGHGDEKAIEEATTTIKREIEDADNSDIEQWHKDRLAWLTGKVALVHVGGSTPTEKISTMHRLDDSIRSSKAALEEGRVIGGGGAYLYACVKLEEMINKWDTENCDGSFYSGYDAMMYALRSPITQIMANASIPDGEIEDAINEIIAQIREGDNINTFNVITQQMETMEETQIWDSTKVVTTAIMKAASVAAVFATTEVLNYNEHLYYAGLKENYIPN